MTSARIIVGLASLCIGLLLSTVSWAVEASADLFENAVEQVEEPTVGLGMPGAIAIPVPKMTIYPGQVITDQMLRDRDFSAEGQPVPAVYTLREGLVGRVARQTLLPNAAVHPTNVREPFVVKQGMPAVVMFSVGTLTISTTAVPLEAGAVGDSISLRNVDSGTTIRGVVAADGTVRVGGQ